eukprot:1155518-Prymnesium_polylepis.2
MEARRRRMAVATPLFPESDRTTMAYWIRAVHAAATSRRAAGRPTAAWPRATAAARAAVRVGRAAGRSTAAGRPTASWPQATAATMAARAEPRRR